MSNRGLEGVVVAQSTISKVFGEEGRLVYRGYEIEDLAENASFEEVCHLLWHGELPDGAALDELRSALVAERALPSQVIDILRALPASTHPMAALRTAVSALAGFDEEADDLSRESNLRKAIRLTARMPTITAAFDRIRSGRDPIDPRSDLDHAANFLYMLTGTEPDDLSSRIMDAALTLHAEHGMNASTFSARVTVATLSDTYSGVTSAIGTLKGPLHGGANEGVMRMLEAIGEPERAADWVRGALDRGERIMGFGHRIYRTLDPRAPILKRLATKLSERVANTRWLAISEVVQDTMREEMDRRGKKIYPNVDFFSASVYYTLGFPTDTFTNIFACARVSGWTAHIMEQLENNRLIRPRGEYVGEFGKKVVAIAQRA